MAIKGISKFWIALVFLVSGGCGMAGELKLEFEWPNGREPGHRLAVQVESVKPYKSGWFGLKNSPSISKLPDPIEVTAKVLAGNPSLLGETIELVMPKLMLEGLSAGDRMAVGVLDQKVCICVASIKAETKDLDQWLNQWQCDEPAE